MNRVNNSQKGNNMLSDFIKYVVKEFGTSKVDYRDGEIRALTFSLKRSQHKQFFSTSLICVHNTQHFLLSAIYSTDVPFLCSELSKFTLGLKCLEERLRKKLDH